MALQEYKCPCCGGGVAFDSKTQNMKCPYCDTEFEVETLSSYDEELKNEPAEEMAWDTKQSTQFQEGEGETLHNYRCNSCGGEIIGDETMAAAACPFCGNPVVMMDKLSGSLKPDYVIPFKVDKKAAKSALQKYYGNKKLLPKVFKDENHIDEIKGVYVPFWIFDSAVEANIRYKATKVRTWSNSDYIFTETSYFAVTRDGELRFEKVPVDGSIKMADELMESIEPFDFSEAVGFQTAYLAGYFANKYDVDAEKCAERANTRIKKSTEDVFAGTVHGYSTVVPEHVSIRLKDGSAKYALYPVWMLNTTWNGNQYMFAMNGQTGKFVGNLPMDKAAYRKWLFGLTGAISAAVFIITYLLWLL